MIDCMDTRLERSHNTYSIAKPEINFVVVVVCTTTHELVSS